MNNKIRNFYYDVPITLKAEETIVAAECDVKILAFNEKCIEEIKRINAERELRLKNRTWQYSVKEMENGWKMLFKKAVEPSGEKDDEQWSKPFRIINNVLIHKEYCFERQHWATATDRIPQGLVCEGFDANSITGW
jgi:hypothetical protein